MTDRDLASLAKAGDRAAVNELLRRATPALRWHVRLALRGAGASFDVFEDAFAAALEQAWKAVDRWDPEQGSLAAFVGPGVHSESTRIAGQMGHAASIPSYYGAEQSKYARFRNTGLRRPHSMESPLPGSDNPDPLVERLRGAAANPEVRHDAARILGRLSEREARVLWVRANQGTDEDAGRAVGCSGDYAGTLLTRALVRARAFLGVVVAPPAAAVKAPRDKCTDCQRCPPREGRATCITCAERSSERSKRRRAERLARKAAALLPPQEKAA